MLIPTKRTPLSVPDKHQLRIAHRTLEMSDVGAFIMGGMTKAKASEVIQRLGKGGGKTVKLSNC